MSVVLRLSRVGKHKSPSYRVVAAEKARPRDGRFLEIVGTFNPLKNPAECSLKEDLIKKWIGYGATPSTVVSSLIKKSFPGILEAREDNKRKKTQEARRKRKQRAKAKSK